MMSDGRLDRRWEFPILGDMRAQRGVIEPEILALLLDEGSVAVERLDHRSKLLVDKLVLENNPDVVKQSGQERVFKLR